MQRALSDASTPVSLQSAAQAQKLVAVKSVSAAGSAAIQPGSLTAVSASARS